MTGVDPAAPYRGLYGSRKDARSHLRQAGGFSRVFGNSGMKEIPGGLAARGDVLQLGAFSLGLIALDGRRVIVLARQLTMTVPDLKGRAWHV